ncbi:MAG: hypothetical protein KJ614_04720 [Gammaproteobacteria bacterium]|uniref:hypothetical protein n=1 Tax=Rhodoferax sp. TaxID=50421 RepID=UPI001823832F|nr:hypothetical protein [Rhodoferax sp.]MBU3898223.1 hypothetical protein [Gammaproteobacteria bacterium]MBA3059078.1 hypothetical protein [Rhodoferax sp.]MBU3996973.1 hypothetical protein [Gammaproteobacteria bacterium]MBU4081408.1 hypothetical protein [Gammaproteobacteria bacterium]MBU4114187.1 hypothetical protein [Gammaproteobacteria bacterium]
MKNSTKIGTLGAIAIAAAATLVVSCGGGSGGDTPAAIGTATTLDAASVTKGIAMVATLLPVCSSPGASQTAALQGNLAPAKVVWLAKKFALSQSPQRRILALGSVPPADLLGGCGGRLTYPASAYSHLNGVTTATLAFENYCTVNTDNNTRLVLNGNLAFVDNGTPSASGPIRNWISADSPAGVTIATQDASGVAIDSMLLSFSNFRYTVGVPGDDPTAASPDRFTLGELATTTQSTGKTYRATGFSAEMFATPSGGEQFTVSGRAYRSNGEYFDVTTSTPLVLDVDGNPTAGAITFKGANDSTAVATVVPGTVMQVTMTVNGTPLAGMPACQ